MEPAGAPLEDDEPRRHFHQTYDRGRNSHSGYGQSMKNIIAIVQRELGTYFVSPVAYVVLTIFLFVTGWFFEAVLSQVLRASMMQAMQSAQMGGAANPIDVPAIVSQNFLSSTSVILLF